MIKRELDDNILAQIRTLCHDGDILIKKKDFKKALQEFQAALNLLPEPIFVWDAATWIFAAIGDAHFLSGEFHKAYEAFSKATQCPKGIGNPFIHLRLGEIQFELGNEIIAADELARAYMGAGSKIFSGEPAKYFAMVKTKLKEPPGGWDNNI